MIRFKKPIAFIMSLVMICTVLATSATTVFASDLSRVEVATENKLTDDKNTTLSPTLPSINEDDVIMQPQGIKKDAVVFALKYGGKLLGEIIENIGDKKVGQLLKDNAYVIGDFLDSITDSIEAKLIDFMIFQLGFPSSAARIIAWTITTLFL
ncbi:MAG: hypothetical protein K0R05_3643 [Anaerocolumna sp.]|jgi:hypothetical protein|nr:hypothetical protein [Anaerocolumna sp.]